MRALVRLMTVPAEKRDAGWLAEALQAAIQLELSTIPPYLYAAWSIDSNTDPSSCAAAIQQIAVEEMLHLGIACNLLASIGHQPDVLGVAPRYPARLPMDVHEGLEVALTPFSPDVLLKTFMVIEEPTSTVVVDPDFVPTGSTLIGQFYEHVRLTFRTCPVTFTSSGQINLDDYFFMGSFVITGLDDVDAAIDLIKRQGEGTSATPFEQRGDETELAHFYQFGEIYHGQRLTRTVPFAYTGESVTTPTVRAVTPAPAASAESVAFDRAYSTMLTLIHTAWNGGGGNDLRTAVNRMPALGRLAEKLILAGFGPAFRVVAPGPVVPPPDGNRFGQIKDILDAAVGAAPFGAHGPFWRGLTRDQFVQHSIFNMPLVVVGNGRDSNLVRSLRGQAPFGSDTGTAGALFLRMPGNRPPVADADIAIIEHWIDDGCPDAAPVVFGANISLTTGAFRPDPSVHNAYFRDLDDWSSSHATPDVQAAVGTTFDTVEAWLAFARDPAAEQAWIDAISPDDVRQAVAMLAARQKQTIEAHYGVPVPLLTVLDGFERFGNDGLPDDPLRPNVPRYNMNGAVMWFVQASFAEACVRLDISTDFWTFMMRPVLCGLLNDGLFRGRFTVEDFAATPEGRQAVFEHSQHVADADLPGELRKRYVESGL